MIQPIFQVKTEKESENFGVFILEPLQQGYGQTLGNALRRVLLSSLPGAAITKAKINGVKHIFSVLKGLKEDMVEFILNLKKVRIKYQGNEPVKITLSKIGPGKIKAGDFEVPAGVEIMNKDLVLGSLADKNSKLKGEFWVESGYGYIPFEEKEPSEVGIIPLDAIFTPVNRVNYKVSATRVGRVTNFDRLTLELSTDSTISPKNALLEAGRILTAFFSQVVEQKQVAGEEGKTIESQKEELIFTVEELELPTRIVNALLKVGIKDIKDLREAGIKKLSKIKNLGGKSLKIIQASLSEKGINLEE